MKVAPAARVASTVTSDGTVMTGAVVSLTVTMNEADPLLPRASLAVQFTVVGPSGKIVPLAGLHVGGTMPSMVSVADVVKVNAPPVAPVASIVALAGTVTTGGVVSATVTVNDAVLMFPRASLAVQLTVVVPSGNVAPLAGVQVTATVPSTASLAVAV